MENIQKIFFVKLSYLISRVFFGLDFFKIFWPTVCIVLFFVSITQVLFICCCNSCCFKVGKKTFVQDQPKNIFVALYVFFQILVLLRLLCFYIFFFLCFQNSPQLREKTWQHLRRLLHSFHCVLIVVGIIQKTKKKSTSFSVVFKIMFLKSEFISHSGPENLKKSIIIK